ncbi:Rpn family recombination-promoting nuclease/putative transposase [Streptococcus sp. 4477]|uniref:Rpn family recombination-promoting nuclease/putative transposase n=1 Tax=Streptococcus sp. 4477 TaxID=2582686 RepID=UPI001561C858|nr:Rpn family recombination-promoting nuclease/putative transposase [Streptococcus sp. 4477]
MTVRHPGISPTNDLVAKKIFSNPEITCQFIRDMLDLPAKNVTILEGSNIHVLPSLPYSAQDFYTSIDVLAELDNGTQVIIEIQVHHQNFFINRLWTYLCSQVNQNLEKIRQREGDTHHSYKHIAPVYAIAIVDSNYFSDDLAFHSFSMREDSTGEVLTITNNGQENHLVKMAFLELRKYRETSKDSIRKPWLEFFGNKPFTQQPERAISQADQLLDYKSWSEEDKRMFSEQRRREEQALLAHDYALEQAEEKGLERGLERGRAEGIEQGIEKGIEQGLERGRAEGIEQGIERGRAEGIEQGLKVSLANLVRQGLLTPEVASEQLGMTVAEFEELLKEHHK